MKNQLTTISLVLLSITFFFNSCRSTSVIYSSPTSKVYNRKGELKGETPYTHSDLKVTGMTTKYKLKAEGFEDLDIKIRRLERVQYANIFFGLLTIAPFLWLGHYKSFHAYNLEPNDGAKRIESDFVEYKESIKTNNKGFPIYIGTEGNKHYTYVNGEIIEMDSQFQKINSFEVSSSAKRYRTGPIDAFIQKGSKCVLDIDPDGDILMANVLDKNGQVFTKKLQKVIHEREIINPESQFGYNRPIDGDEFIAYNEKKIYHYNLDFQLIDEYAIEGTLLEAKLTNSGVIVSLESDGNSIYIIKRDATEDKHAIEYSNSRGLSNIRLNLDEDLNRIFISYLLSPESAVSIKKGDDDTYFNGVKLITYDLTTFKQLSEKNIDFNDDIIEKGSFPSKDNQGIKFLINRGVVANKDNVYINLEEQWITIVTSENSIKSILNARGIITINANKKESLMAFIQKNGVTSYEYERLSYNQILKGDKIHYLFNDNVGFTKPIVQQIILDSNMNRLSQNVFDLYNDQKTVLNTARTYQLDGSKRLIFHSRKKRLGAAIIDFDLED